jgi:DMSO/TMAO reductase YedYZ molybdopterin-dependent catalytic subunit
MVNFCRSSLIKCSSFGRLIAASWLALIFVSSSAFCALTGPALASILDDAGVKPEANILIFYTNVSPSGYTSLDLSYIREKNVIIALKLNDITLPPDRGFPFQVVAEGKLGYKWAKWVTRIEVSDNENFRGYWESRGYSNSADAN